MANATRASSGTSTTSTASTTSKERLPGVWLRSRSGYPYRVRDGTGRDKTRLEPMFVVGEDPVFFRSKTIEVMRNDSTLQVVDYLDAPSEAEYQTQVKTHAELIAQDRAKHDRILGRRREEAEARGGSPMPSITQATPAWKRDSFRADPDDDDAPAPARGTLG